MAVDWTPHRFSGGVLALDVANTVVHRGGPRRFDRFAERAEIARFARAASLHRADEMKGCPLDLSEAEGERVVGLREATDRLFRDGLGRDALAPDLVPPFLRAAAHAMGDGFGAAVAWSALGLLPEARRARVRACPNCAWLFLDASRNGSRTWCDMRVCGNRQKAKRHRAARKGAGDD